MTILSTSDISDLYQKTFDKLYRFFYYKLLSHPEAEDLTQQTYLNFVSRAKNNIDITNPEDYLFGIAKNVFIRYLQKKYAAPKTISIDICQDILARYSEEKEDIEIAKQTLEEIAVKYISLLPSSQYAVIKLRLLDKMSVKEIADELNKSIDYVKTNQKRGIKSLRKLLTGVPLSVLK